MQLRLFIILFLIGFVLFSVLLKVAESTWGLSFFFGFFAGAVLGLLSIPIAKIVTKRETNGLKAEIGDRLNSHPEVISARNNGYSRMYD